MSIQLPKRSSNLILGLIVLASAGAGVWLVFNRGKQAQGSEALVDGPGTSDAPPVRVEVAKPTSGGLLRTCISPGSVEPFESADLYSKASGYLIEQSVDIGSHVTKDQVLARISVPEYETQVQPRQGPREGCGCQGPPDGGSLEDGSSGSASRGFRGPVREGPRQVQDLVPQIP